MKAVFSTVVLVVTLLLAATTSAWYIPSAATDYESGANVEVQVNVLNSVHTHLPFDYYDLPTCFPQMRFRGKPENLGEILMGDRIKPSPYERIEMGQDKGCELVCEANEVVTDEKRQVMLNKLIQQDYQVNLIMDNLPLATIHEDTNTYNIGVPLGYVENGKTYVYNHLQFLIKYYELSPDEVRKKEEANAKKLKAQGKPTANPHDDEDELSAVHRVISFVVHPMSIHHLAADAHATCGGNYSASKHYDPMPAGPDVVFSYGVKWIRTEEKFSTRWDVYLQMDHDIHWFSIINSVLIVLFLSTMVAVIILRALRKDISKFNADRDPEDLVDESGWKMIHKDVFRTPEYAPLLAALTGTGCQLLGMTLSVLVIACLGFLSPERRGSLFTTLLVFFVFLGMYAGYTSARLLKVWGQPSWKSIFLTAVLAPGGCFCIFFFINLVVWSMGSSAAVPFATMLAVISMWFCISLPLVFVGAVVGYKRENIKLPVAINQIPRHLPQTTWHMNPLFTIAVGGILPFGAVFIEVFFILNAVWMNKYYYVFGFLFLVFLILTITCAEITIVMVYFQLCAEDYRWWWRSFLTSASTGAYLFVYSAFYFFTAPLKIRSFVSILIYFGYMGMLSGLFSIMTGTIGFMASFLFTRKIYGSIKVD